MSSFLVVQFAFLNEVEGGAASELLLTCRRFLFLLFLMQQSLNLDMPKGL